MKRFGCGSPSSDSQAAARSVRVRQPADGREASGPTRAPLSLWAHIPAVALISAGVLLSVACMQRTIGGASVPAGPRTAHAPAPVAAVSGPPGSVNVAVPFPGIKDARKAQYVYDSGYVYSVELHLYDSQGNYQNFLVVRNTDSATGLKAGTASVTFSNVPPGLCTLSVHTSQKQYYGSVGSGSLIEPSPTLGNNAFAVTGVGSTVWSRFSDVSSPFMVFRSNDITGGGADGAPTSVLFSKDTFKARNGLDKEMFDTTTVSAGYGMGAATATIAPASTTVINVTVTQPPVWNKTLYDTVAKEFATVSAGVDSTLSAPAGALATDKVLIASGSLSLANGDLLDLKDLPENGLLCNVADGAMTIPASVQAGTYAVYPVRGSLVSRIGEIDGKVPPRLVVLPGAISAAKVTFSATATELAAGEAATVSIGLFDAAGNPVKTLDGLLAGLNDGATVSSAIVPVSVATASTYLVGGRTYGTLPTLPRNNADGIYAALYTQGSVASSQNGTAGSATVTNAAGNVLVDPGFNRLFLPNGLTAAVLDTITVEASDSTPNTAFSLKRGDTIFATRSPIGAAAVEVNIPLATAFNTPIVGANFPAAVFTFSTVLTDSTPINPVDANGSSYRIDSFGRRKAGDTDRIDITVQASDSSVVATSSITITWK